MSGQWSMRHDGALDTRFRMVVPEAMPSMYGVCGKATTRRVVLRHWDGNEGALGLAMNMK